MSYDAVFGSFELDMIALESAVQLYEVENDLDTGYLNNDTSYDALAANESAQATGNDDEVDSVFAFGSSLFETTVAMESEGAEGDSSGNKDKKKESFGSKLKNGIKSILANIGKFFRTLAQKVKEIGSKISNKLKEMATKSGIKKEGKLRDAVIKEAGNVRSAFQKAVNILDNTVKTSATEVNKICTEINKAIAAAKTANADLKADSAGLKSVGSNYGGDADKDIDTMRKHVSNAETAEKHVTAAINAIASSYDQLCAKMSKLKIQHAANTRMSEGERTDWETGTGGGTKGAMDAQKARKDSIAEGNKDAVEKFNKDHKDNKVSGGSDTVTITKEMIKAILISEEYTQKTNITKLQSECDAVSKTCDQNADFCSAAEKVAESDINDDTGAAKKAYNLCKLYMEASRVFTRLSSHITQLSTGSVFGSTTRDENIKFKDE